jgi:hypothetical protein
MVNTITSTTSEVQADVHLRKLATVSALKKLFQVDGFFDICTVDKIRTAWNLAVPRDVYATMHLLHCVRYDDMPLGTREHLIALITGMVREHTPDFDFEAALLS